MARQPKLERRISSVLGSISPLTAGQIVRALQPTNPMVVYVTVYRLHKRGVLGHVSNGRGMAYALAGA